jgi:hypothetical protein
MRMGFLARSAAVAAMLCLFAAGAAAQIVVLDARGPSASAYPQGAVLAPAKVIVLKAGDQLEVLDTAGSHVLSGPATVTAGQIATGSRAGLRDIFRRANASRPGIAAVRGFSLDQGPPQPAPDTPLLWRLDVSAWQQAEPKDAHDFCVAKGRTPVVTRDAYGADGALTITQESTQATRTVIWPAGTRDLAWPTDLPIAAGVYDLDLDAAGATKVRWRSIVTGPSLTSLAGALLDNGCYDQLDSLQSRLSGR